MTQFLAVTRNTFLQTLRQPIYGIIVLATLGTLALEPSITGWTLDDDNKLLRDLGLSTLLVQGLFLAAFGAAGVISKEIEDQTVLTVVAKPIRRATFMAGKYAGVLLALCLAHYMAILGLVMMLRHGVLQTSAESSDVTVLIAGPGVMLVVMLAAAVLNYLFDWKYLSTTVIMGVIALTLSTFVLLFIDRHGKFRTYELTQEVLGLPANVLPERDFKNIITYRDTTEPGSKQPTGLLVRSEWLGPISDADRAFLLSLSEEENWVKNVNFLVLESRKLVTSQMLKGSILLIGALAILASFAVAVSTRLSTPWTLLLTLLLLAVGLVTDGLLGPIMRTAEGWKSTVAGVVYRIVPNFQFFWLIDAISEDRVIPAAYMLNCFAYAALMGMAILALGAALFETREVG